MQKSYPVACLEVLMWYETSDSYEEFRKFQQASTTDSGLHIVIAEYLHIGNQRFSYIFDSCFITSLSVKLWLNEIGVVSQMESSEFES